MTRLKLLARTWWLSVPEPRTYSFGWGAAYLMLGLAGVAALVTPPVSFAGVHGSTAAVWSVSVLNLAGMVIAMACGWCEFWKGERLGITLMLGAAAVFALMIATTTDDLMAHVMPFCYIGFVLVVLSVRWLMIRWYTFRPREG